ncbi:MAG: oligosaccharide flippase family protein [Mucilaginibacter sp.]
MLLRTKIVQNLSANTLQLVSNQLLGLGIFYTLSATLNKNNFGQLNLALAILLAVFNILTLGMDQLIIKRVAGGASARQMLSLYLFHVLIAGGIFYGLLLVGWLIIPANNIYNLILLIGIGKLLIFFSTPFKQIVSGMERFKLLARMLVISNFIRCICLVVLVLLHAVTLPYIISIFIAGDGIELLAGIYLFKKNTDVPLTFKWDKGAYAQLLHEAIPQSGVVIIAAALARLDWIFVGFLLSTVKLAEYSFAYKVFEMATLPLLAIAPLLIPYFTRLFKQDNFDVGRLKFLLKMELVIAGFTVLLLNIYWAPAIDTLTAGKYGAVNSVTIFILSLCIPLMYLQNFLWTLFFAQGKLKMILRSFILTLLINIAADIILIPLYKNEGAAAGFLLSCLAQNLFFLKKNNIAGLNNSLQQLIVCLGCALAAVFAVRGGYLNAWLIFPCCISIYFILLIITRQLSFADKTQLGAILHPIKSFHGGNSLPQNS